MSSAASDLSIVPDPFRPLDVAERALWTGVQVFLAAVPLNLTQLPADEAKAVALASLAAAIGVIVSAVRSFVAQRARDRKAITNPVTNLADRFLWTFLAAGVAMVPTVVELDLAFWTAVGHGAVTAGIAAVIALAKNLTGEGVVAQASLRLPSPTTVRRR